MTAQELLKAAQHAEASGDTRGALRHYDQIMVNHAGSDEAELAQAKAYDLRQSNQLNQSVIVKTYPGRYESAFSKFQEDAKDMARLGYFPESQNYTPGAYGCGSFLIALLLVLVLIGIIVFIYMLLVKPPGVLTVTYQYKGVASAAAAEKTCPRCAEQVKEAAKVCRFCGHDFTLQPIS